MAIGRALVKQRARIQRTACKTVVTQYVRTSRNGRTHIKVDDRNISATTGLPQGQCHILAHEERYTPLSHIIFIHWCYVPKTKKEKRIHKGIRKRLEALQGCERLPLRESNKPRYRVNAINKTTLNLLEEIAREGIDHIFLTEIN